jgi:hypothetical protein
LALEVLAAPADVAEPQARAMLISIAAAYDDLAIKAALTAPLAAFVQQPIPRPPTKSDQ